MNRSAHPPDPEAIADIVRWLVDGAPPPKRIEALIDALAQRLRDAGLPVQALVVNGFYMHPKIRGIRYYWTDTHPTRRGNFDHDVFHSTEYFETPLQKLQLEGCELRYRLDDIDLNAVNDYSAGYAARGYTDLLLIPLVNTDGTITGNLEVATKAADGFTEPHVRSLRRIQPPMARLKEIATERFDKQMTLATYLGLETSRKVLSGSIVLGDGQDIPAIVLMADLAGFTALSNTAPSRTVLATLNTFFAAIDAAVTAHEGQILKFLGDGVLVLFPATTENRRHAAMQALASLDAARAALADGPAFRAALHTGDVFFGNVGSGDRLDFTAIGPAVNLTARLLALASDEGAETVCSTDFLSLTTIATKTSVTRRLKGWDADTDIHVLD